MHPWPAPKACYNGERPDPQTPVWPYRSNREDLEERYYPNGTTPLAHTHTHTHSLTHFLLLCLNVAEDQSPQTKKRYLPHSTRTDAMDNPERKQRRLVSLAASEICARVCAFEGFWDCVPWLPGPCAYVVDLFPFCVRFFWASLLFFGAVPGECLRDSLAVVRHVCVLLGRWRSGCVVCVCVGYVPR